jgi:hypothetical protein
MRINAQKEFLAHIEKKPAMDVLAAALTIFNDDADDSSATFAKLEPGYSAEDYEAFLAKIDVEYGSPVRWMLYGRIWYEDGTSSARAQDLHGEWWEFQAAGPDIADTLKKASHHAARLANPGGDVDPRLEGLNEAEYVAEMRRIMRERYEAGVAKAASKIGNQ